MAYKAAYINPFPKRQEDCVIFFLPSGFEDFSVLSNITFIKSQIY